MRLLLQKAVGVFLAGVITAAVFVPCMPVEAAGSGAEGINVTYHTQAEIIARIRSDGLTMEDSLTIAENPVTEAPYSAGSLSQDTHGGCRLWRSIRVKRYI